MILQEVLKRAQHVEKREPAFFLPREPNTEIRAVKVSEEIVDLVVTHWPRRGPEQRWELQYRPAERTDIAFGNPSMEMPRLVQRELVRLLVDDEAPIGTTLKGQRLRADIGWRYWDWKRTSGE